MHVPLVISVLALLGFALLPRLARYTGTETGAHGLRLVFVRLAHWINT
jgi:hypothetical protein